MFSSIKSHVTEIINKNTVFINFRVRYSFLALSEITPLFVICHFSPFICFASYFFCLLFLFSAVNFRPLPSFADESIDSFCASTFASRVSLLRNFCLKIGLQLQLRDYALGGASASSAAGDNGAATSPTRGAEGDSSPMASPNGASKRPSAASTPPMGGLKGGASSTAPLFVADDVLGMFPIVKHVNPKATDAYHFFTSGQAKVQQGDD